MSTIVIALGGNALGKTAAEQRSAVQIAAEHIAGLAAAGHNIVLSHGNGPQVGMINLGMNQITEMPFPECGAMSQGYIGFHLQNALAEALRQRKIDRTVATVVTQVVVDPDDPGFSNPTKPIGSFHTAEEAKAIAKEKGYTMKEDAGRGWRRVIASPAPKEIVELKAIKAFLETGVIPVAAGGGGIPVIRESDGTLDGVAAVIDKDFASEKLAEDVGADTLLILTAVDSASINFRKPEQQELRDISVSEAERHIRDGQFAAGSMLPKIQAAVKFASSRKGRRAVITSLEKATLALDGAAGTSITA